MYLSKIPTQVPGTLTRPLALADLASGSTNPYSSFSSCLSMTVAFFWLPLTPICSLLWDLVFPRLLPVSLEILRTNPLCGFHTKTDKESSDWCSPTERMPTILVIYAISAAYLQNMWNAPGRRWEKPLDYRIAMSWFKKLRQWELAMSGILSHHKPLQNSTATSVIYI